MGELTISIASELEAAGLNVTLGMLEADVVVEPAGADLIADLDAIAESCADGSGAIAPTEVPEVAAARRAYKALGKDPSRYRPSVEALMRRVRQGKGLFQVNNVVDVNNLISLKSGFCVGTYDVARLVPPLVLRPGSEGETYDAIGRGSLNLSGLPLLVDESGPFGSPTSDSERTMIRPQTERILMVLYDFDSNGDIGGALDFADASLKAYCNARNVVHGTASARDA